MAEQQRFPGMPEDAEIIALEKFSGLNTKNNRQSIDDQEFSWCENFIPIGEGNLRTMYGAGSSIYTATGGKTIIVHYFYNIGSTQYAIVFLSDGTAYQVNVNTLAVTTISSSANTFYNGGNLPDVSQFGSSGILIVGTVTVNSYWAWDGTLYPPGNATSPTWLNGGTPTAMPNGISGTGIEIYQSRVWIVKGASLYGSAPSNGAQFATGSAGVLTTSSDSFLKQTYVQLKQVNSFLYTFADSSINSISNVQVSGSTTTFNNLNTDPQVGTPWHGSVVEYGRYLLCANTSGVYAVLGGAAQKISDKLDGFFAKSSLPLTGNNLPSAAVATIFGIKLYILLIPGAVDYLGVSRPLMAIWDEKKWFIGSQTQTLTSISTQEISSNLTAWGTDGTNLFPLFNTASSSLNKIVQGKLWNGQSYLYAKQALQVFLQIQDNAGTGVTALVMVDSELTSQTVNFSASGVINFINNTGGTIQFQNNTPANINFAVPSDAIVGNPVNQYGHLLGLTLTTQAKDATIISEALMYKPYSMVI